MKAAEHGHTDIVQLLLENGAGINTTDDVCLLFVAVQVTSFRSLCGQLQRIPAMFAAWRNQGEAMRVLLDLHEKPDLTCVSLMVCCVCFKCLWLVNARV